MQEVVTIFSWDALGFSGMVWDGEAHPNPAVSPGRVIAHHPLLGGKTPGFGQTGLVGIFGIRGCGNPGWKQWQGIYSRFFPGFISQSGNAPSGNSPAEFGKHEGSWPWDPAWSWEKDLESDRS